MNIIYKYTIVDYDISDNVLEGRELPKRYLPVYGARPELPTKIKDRWTRIPETGIITTIAEGLGDVSKKKR
jgi:hypothetical protein